MGMLISKIRLVLGGKKALATSVVLLLVAIAASQGIELSSEEQKGLELGIAALIAIFIRLAIKKGQKSSDDAVEATKGLSGTLGDVKGQVSKLEEELKKLRKDLRKG